MSLNTHLKELAHNMDIDFFGIADLQPARDAILEQGGPLVGDLPRAISLGIGLMHAIVDQLPHHEDLAVLMTYQRHAYDRVNDRLDDVASRLSSLLQREGYRALPVPASQIMDRERLRGLFSHKLAAHLAGLGWIGKSCLLVTPEMGPRVRWATVLTDAPLEATGTAMDVRCGSCQECVDICPAGAFTGRAFREGEPREARYAADKCHAYLQRRSETVGMNVCGLCLYVCPNGRKQAWRV